MSSVFYAASSFAVRKIADIETTLLLAVIFAGGCGSAPPISISLSPSTAQTDSGQTLRVTATLTNDSSTRGVLWTLSGPGSLSSQTFDSVVYNAPSNVSSPVTATLTATSAKDSRKSASLQVTVNPPPRITDFQTLASGTAGAAYSQTIAETGGSAPFTWSIYAGAVPDGLNLNASTGAITGTPTGGGTWYFEAQLTDSAGVSYYGELSIYVNSTKPPGNPVPLVSQPLVPSAAAPGGPGFTLTVNGTGFVSGATVNFNGTPLATTFVSGSRLTAAVPPSAIVNAGPALITVLNPGPGTGRSNVVLFPVAAVETTVNFANAAGSPLGSASGVYGGSAVVADDFNGDGKLDLAVGGAVRFPILLGNGDGTFTQASGSPIVMQGPPWDNGPTPLTEFVVAGDFRNTGKPDLAVSLVQNEGAAMLLGDGKGGFTLSSTFVNSAGSPTVALASADFNGDGNLDLATGNSFSGSPLVVSLGYADGAFNEVGNSPFGLSSGITAIAVGDFNGDGKLDLAVNANGVTILLGDGSGNFTQAPGSPAAAAAAALVVADFNGDGKLDIAAADFNGNTVIVLLGNGDGTFTQAGSRIPVGTEPLAIGVGDFVGNGKLDLAVANNGSNDVTILLGNGDGTFAQAGSPIPVGKAPTSIAVGDFNGSGRLGLAVANGMDGTVTILMQK